MEGIISMPSEGLICATITQDGGWTAAIDGEPTQTLLLCDNLIGFRVPEGEHSITLTYHVPGLTAGALVSLLSLLILLITNFKRGRRKDIPFPV